MSPRKANMESSIYLGADGWWHGRVTMGIKEDGSPDRRHRRAGSEPEIRRKVRALEKQRDAGHAPKAGRAATVEQWMTTYLTDIASLKLRPRSLDDYWSKTRNDIVPGIGQHRLDKLAPEHLERMYRRMLDAGRAPSHILSFPATRTPDSSACATGSVARWSLTWASKDSSPSWARARTDKTVPVEIGRLNRQSMASARRLAGRC